ncbi:MAG: LAGLIDADG family homing endonuclease [bacterium]|nr:LAGLIDADG family homing endonuclease [bacterium]
MSATASLKFPKKSHRKQVVLPAISPKLAEFMGIMMGDGGINNPWQATITVNAIADKAYASYVHDLCIDLFWIAPAVRKRNGRQALVISLASTTVVDFLVSRGLCRGNKLLQGLKIPSWILKSTRYHRACVRGLVDTDGCLFVHKHRVRGKQYQNIGLCFSSASPKLIQQVASVFEKYGIMPHIDKRGQNLYLYREAAVARYLEIFGTSNERIGSLYQKWRGA